MPQAAIEYEPYPLEAFRRQIGGANWVLARRTPAIVARYGEDVICLSREKYKDAERRAWLLQTEGYD